MKNADWLALNRQLADDIPDWGLVHPDVQSQLIHWILEDRERRPAKDKRRKCSEPTRKEHA